jgi:signal transduction histidine kinase/dsRNA-specific ribonuclease
MNAFDELLNALSLSEAAAPLLSVALTHESALNNRVDASVLRGLLDSLHAVGHSALTAAIIECSFMQLGVADQVLVNIQAPALSKRVIDSLISRFNLVAAIEIGRGLGKTNSFDNAYFRTNLIKRFLGAVVMSSTFDHVRNIVKREIEVSGDNNVSDIREPKSCLQEITQRLYKCAPKYQIVSESGPDHDKVFVCKVSITPHMHEEGTGKTLSSAEKQAALAMITKRKLLQKAPDIVQKYSSCAPVHKALGANAWSLYPAPEALRLAEKLRPNLECDFIDTTHLAVALSLSNKTSGERYDTHFRHKMVGSVMESIAFQIYAFRNIRQDLIASEVADWVRFEAAARTPANYARLYTKLRLDRFVYGNVTGPLSFDRQADVLKAISGAVFLSAGEFNRTFNWMDSKIASWLALYLADLLDHPWKLEQPKTLLQTVIQASGSFEISYFDQESGPAHNRLFSSTARCKRIGEAQYALLGKGQAKLKGEAQGQAALNSIIGLMPRGLDKSTFQIAPSVWQACFENARLRNLSLPRLGLPMHLRMFKSVRAYSEVRSLLLAFPNLTQHFASPEYLNVVIRSAGQATPFPVQQIREFTLAGIDMWTAIAPEDFRTFLSPQCDLWLSDFRKLSNRLKLPASPASWPQQEVEPADLTRLLRMTNVEFRVGKSGPTSSACFAHVATLLEGLDDEAKSSATITVQFSRSEDLHVAVIGVPPECCPPLQCTELISALNAQAFFLGTEVSMRETPTRSLIYVRTVFPSAKTVYSEAFFSILRGMYDKLREIQRYYRVLHDLKNQMIALQNHARAIIADARMKYQTLARIDSVQRELRDRRQALAALFVATEDVRSQTCELFKTFQEFASRELYSLPDNIKLRLDTSVEPGLVCANADHILSVLNNLTRNAVEAMANGGELSVTALYVRTDNQLLVQIADTGPGIPADRLKEMFTSLQSTKRGMGLGLATVGHVVEQYGGNVNVESELGRGTKFSVVLPIEAVKQ